MKRAGLPRFAWALFLLLVVCAVLMALGSRQTQAAPDSASYLPGGAKAFSELLTQNGYKVRRTRSRIERLSKDELGIAFFSAQTTPGYNLEAAKDESPIREMSERHLKNGGALLYLKFEPNLREVTKQAEGAQTAAVEFKGATFEVARFSVTGEGFFDYGSYSADRYDLVVATIDQGAAFAGLVKRHRGEALEANAGTMVLNRFIDRKDHAALALALVRLAAGERKSVVFLEASYGNMTEPSLVERIGPWAAGAWTQATILFFTFVIVSGVRFGYPNVERFVQRGTRELVDAYATVLIRTRSTGLAAKVLHDSADRLVRRRLKIAIDASEEVRDKMIPEELADGFRHMKNASRTRPPANELTSIARDFDHKVASFLGSGERSRARRSKSR